MLDAALNYAARGLQVIPLRPYSKGPLTNLVPHGFKDATNDATTIKAWWAQSPKANIGILTGSQSNLLVIDVDMHDSDGKRSFSQLEAEYGELPPTYTIETANGGLHYYFNFPSAFNDARLKGQLANGIDLKVKGYVVAPPSIVNGRPYVIVTDIGRIELPPRWIEPCIKEQSSPEDWACLRPRGSGRSICEEYGITMSDVLTLPSNARKVGDGYLIKHPIHDATGDGNLFVNPGLNLWCCYRHHTGGDPLTWIAVREGFISCEDAGPLDEDAVKRCLEVLRHEGMIPQDNKPVVIEPNGSAIKIEIRGCDDIANAERFCSKYGDTLRYCTETRKWLEYNGKYWTEISTTAIKHRAREVVTIIRYEAAEAGRLAGKETQEQAKKKQRIAAELNSWARASSFKVRLDAVVDRAKGYLEISALKFDTNPLIVNCENGTYEVATGELRPYHNPEDYCTLITGPYVKGAKNSKWDAFLEKVQPNGRVRAFLIVAVGYSATALTNEEALFYCFGGPQTGKSTFLEAIRSAMGSYGKGEPFSTFLIQGDGSQGRPRPELLRLRGARLIRCIEVSENMRWDSALLNTLVSGEPYAARALFSNDLIEFVPVFKLWCAANHRAKVRYNPEEEDGFWRRLYPIPFQVEIPEDQQDKGLKQYFMTDPDARAAILAEILQGATEWYNLSDRGRINGLHAPPAIITARFDYKAAQSPIYEFLKNECRVGKDAITGEPYRVAVRDLWDLFSDARKGYDTKKVKTPVSLGRYLKGLGFGKEKVKDVRYSVGLRLLKEDEEPDEVFSLRTDGQLESTNLKSSNESSLHEGEIRKEGPNCPTVFDHAELVRTIHETMIAWPSPQHGKKPNCNYFVAAVAAHIRQRYPQWLGRNIEYEINRLNECDSEIQSILAERTVCID